MLLDLFDLELQRLRDSMGRAGADIFPAKYETEFLGYDGQNIAGTFKGPESAGTEAQA